MLMGNISINVFERFSLAMHNLVVAAAEVVIIVKEDLAVEVELEVVLGRSLASIC